jgi:hypothetical protein
MTVSPYQWTIKRYHQAVEAGIFADQALELLRGELMVMPPDQNGARRCDRLGLKHSNPWSFWVVAIETSQEPFALKHSYAQNGR